MEDGIARAPDAILALVTPGQHAPLGVTLSRARRHALLTWAASSGAWIIEDDYLGELQLDGRAAPALLRQAQAPSAWSTSGRSAKRSARRLAWLVVAPRSLAERLIEVAAVLAPAPNRRPVGCHGVSIQWALPAAPAADEGSSTERRNLALMHVSRFLPGALAAGLGVIAPLRQACDDIAVVRIARAHGLAPSALFAWHISRPHAQRGLLLSATNLHRGNIGTTCATLARIVESNWDGPPGHRRPGFAFTALPVEVPPAARQRPAFSTIQGQSGALRTSNSMPASEISSSTLGGTFFEVMTEHQAVNLLRPFQSIGEASAMLAGSASPPACRQSKIRPGFSVSLGSSARFRRLSSATSPLLRVYARNGFFRKPMPCSALTVPCLPRSAL